MSAHQILQDYRDKKRDPVLGPFTYDESAALVAENARLLESLDGATRALVATQRPGGKRKTDPAFVMTPAMMDLGDRLLAIQGETA